MLVHADRLDPLEPGRVADQGVHALGEHGLAGRAPRAREVVRARQHALRLEHDLRARPPHGRVRHPPALRGDARQVVAPQAFACRALVPAHAHEQVHGVLADRSVDEPATP